MIISMSQSPFYKIHPFKMAARDLKLTDEQIEHLAEGINTQSLETIAGSFLGLDEAKIKSIKKDQQFDAERFNKEILKTWKNKNPGSSQMQVTE